MVPGIGSMVLGIGSMVPGIGSMVPGIGSMVPGHRLVPGIGSMVPGHRLDGAGHQLNAGVHNKKNCGVTGNILSLLSLGPFARAMH